MKKLTIVLLTLILGCQVVYSQPIYSQTSLNHVIFQVELISDNSANVTLNWSNPTNKTPIMIVSWSVDANQTVTIKYQQGAKVASGFNKRLISGEGIKFPTIIILEEDLGKGIVTKPIFSDLPQNDEARLAIQFLYDQGIINGYTDGSFKPQEQVTRAEFTKMLFLSAKMITESNPTMVFKDVADNHWAKDYIMTLASKSIVNGVGDSTFKPSGTITLGQVFAIIDRSFILEDQGISYPHALINNWSNEYFTSLVARNIVLASDSFYKSYTPNTIVTRAECAVFLSRILKTYYTSK
jgi:hypothetical protein